MDTKMDKLIKSLSWKMSVLYKIPYDELLHEGYWKFYDTVSNYDPKKGKLHTWMYRVIFNHLRQFSHIWVRWGAKMTSESEEMYKISVDPIQRAFSKIQDFLKELDPDARFIVQTVIQNPDFFQITDFNNITRTRGEIRNALKKQGWTTARINNSIHNIRENVRIYI